VATGDVADPDVWDRVLPQVTAVVNAAGYVRQFTDPGASAKALFDTNVYALARLLAAATRHGIHTVVQVSSIGVLGRDKLTDPEAPLDESAPLRTHELNGYTTSKIAAEGVVAAHVARGDGPRVPLVLPAWMLGPDDHAPSASGRTFLEIAAGRLPVMPRIPLHATDSRDAALACIAALDRDVAGRFIVAGARTDLHAVGVAMARASGARPPAALPAALAVPVTAAAERLAILAGQQPVSTADGTRVLIGDGRNSFSSERAGRELDVTCRPIAETTADMAAWFAAVG
jgi:dihydroflavonol-4-reductase